MLITRVGVFRSSYLGYTSFIEHRLLNAFQNGRRVIAIYRRTSKIKLLRPSDADMRR